MMNSSDVPNNITRERWRAACKALGIPMDFIRLEFRPMEEYEREEHLVHTSRTSYFVCEVTWHDYGIDQDGVVAMSVVTKRIPVNIGATLKERMGQE
jgi:hypothetical protein